MMLKSVAGTNTYVSDTTYDSAGRINLRTFGNGTQSDYDYYAWNTQTQGQGGRLQTLKSGTSAATTSLQNLTYTYDTVATSRASWMLWPGRRPRPSPTNTLDRLTARLYHRRRKRAV